MQRHFFASKGLSSQSCGFSSSHVGMWELDYKESWTPKNWCLWTGVVEKNLESPLDCKEIQPVHPKGNQSWIFIGRTDAEAETRILWPPYAKNWLIKKDWRQEENGTAEDEMVGLIPTQWTWVWVKLGELVMNRESWRAALHWIAKSQTRMNNWTELNWTDWMLIGLVCCGHGSHWKVWTWAETEEM